MSVERLIQVRFAVDGDTLMSYNCNVIPRRGECVEITKRIREDDKSALGVFYVHLVVHRYDMVLVVIGEGKVET